MNTIWTQYMADRIKHVEKRVPWWVNNKSTLNQFCLDNEIPAPIVFKQWESPEKADFSGLPERFVLKPNLMSSHNLCKKYQLRTLTTCCLPASFTIALPGLFKKKFATYAHQ